MNFDTLPDCELSLIHCYDESEAIQLFNKLLDDTLWRQDKIVVYGKEYNVPRLQQWYGDFGYTWSGIKMNPLPWTKTLLNIRERVQKMTGHGFNSVLLNRYRNGSDTVGYHADDEPELGKEPVIASLSLGAKRDFLLKHNTKEIDTVKISLENGSLLIMSGKTQENWKHSLPRRKTVTEERINLTFRNIKRLGG